MALARIISRSHARSRELAFDLLARGYAVEIVSPDAVPDNLADLELRVDADPADQSIASVEAPDGGRSVSLDFLEHMKAPMGDFRRRTPEPAMSVETGGAGTGETPVRGESKTRQQPAASRIKPLQPVSPLQATPPASAEPPKYFAVQEPSIPRPIDQGATLPLPRRSLRRDPGARWRWWTALAFASLAMLTLGFGFGLRRMEKDAAQLSGAAPTESAAAGSTDTSLMSPANAEPISAAIVPARETMPMASPEVSSAVRTRAKVSHRYSDDVVAPNTITYLDKRFYPKAPAISATKAKPVKHVAHRRPSPRQRRRDVIAANKVAALDRPARKAAK